MSKLTPTDPISLRSAITRAFRTLSVSLADVVGPSQWGLRLQRSFIRDQAKYVLSVIFHTDMLNIYLPLLMDPSSQVSISIAQLLGGTMRTQEHRTAVAEWLPPAEKEKQAKAKRGWEKPAIIGLNAPNRLGGWVAKHLTDVLKGRDNKLHEAAVLALAALAKENTPVASALAKSTPDQPSALSVVISHSRSRSTDVQIAACLCATHILRASTPTSHSIVAGPSSASHTYLGDDAVAKTIISIIARLITIPPTESIQAQIKACYVLHYLVMDELSLCQIVFERGGVSKLTTLLQEITKPQCLEAWDEDEPENVSALREACLMALATLALSDNEIRRHLADFIPNSSAHQPHHHSNSHPPPEAGGAPPLSILQIIQISLSHHHAGVRYAACQCVRAISRAVAVLRTSIMDCGVGAGVFGVFMGMGAKKMIGEIGKEVKEGKYWGDSGVVEGAGRKEKKKDKEGGKDKQKGKEEKAKEKKGEEGKEKESDVRVLNAAAQAMCNLVTLHSPLRPTFLRRGLVKRLVELMHGPEVQLRLNSIWVIKNLLTQSSLEMKENVMEEIGWKYFVKLLRSSEDDVKEQAFHVLRNLAEDEYGVELLFKEIGADDLLGLVTSAMESTDERVVLQAVHALANLANGIEEHKTCILTNAELLKALRTCIAESRSDIRRPAVSCVYELTRSKRRKEIIDAGFIPTLKKVAEYSGAGISPGGAGGSHGHGHGHHASGHGYGHSAGGASGGRSPLYGHHAFPTSPGAGGSGYSPGFPSFSAGPGASSSSSSFSPPGAFVGPSSMPAGGGLMTHGVHSFGTGLGIGPGGTGPGIGSGGGMSASTIMHLEEEVVEQAKAALDRLEHSALYASTGSP
ncbi:hypothetical protein AX16_001949 [Volvariella volvacea WC 439]|nr:hypothetical protein AX16_001949 [Volvariella volvacea WC 439]